MNKGKIVQFFKNNFGVPTHMNWGYPLMWSAVGTALVYIIVRILNNSGFLFSTSSLAGFTIIVSLLTVMAFFIPAVIASGVGKSDNVIDPVGKFTGIGPVILSILSGIPMVLVYVPLHNLTAYLMLKLGGYITFPAFFCVNDASSTVEKILSYVTNDIIPGLGICFLFFGLMFTLFSKKDIRFAYIILPLALAFSSINAVDFLGIAAIGIWLCFLREKTGNIYTCFFSILSAGVAAIFINPLIKSVDISMVQTYSDMDKTFFYSSLPAFCIGVILFAFFKKTFTDFDKAYNQNYNSTPDEQEERNTFRAGINIPSVIAVIIYIVLWICNRR